MIRMALSLKAKVLKALGYNFGTRYTLSHIDDLYDKLKRDVGSDFRRRREENIVELYLFHCGNCRYRNMHDIKMLYLWLRQ